MDKDFFKEVDTFIFNDDPTGICKYYENIFNNPSKIYKKNLFDTLPDKFSLKLSAKISPTLNDVYVYFDKMDKKIMIFKNSYENKDRFYLSDIVNSLMDNKISPYLLYIAYIDEINRNKKIMHKISNFEKNKKEVVNNYKGDSKNNNIRQLSKNRIIYEKVSDYENLNKRSYTRKAESWTVLGFTRHLKNGKTVQVKPHIRGQGKLKNKEYIVR